MNKAGMWLACALAVGGTVEVEADFRESYRRGIQARNRQNWTEAVRWFTQAADERPAETGEAVNISGAAFEPYLPYFQLGMAHYNMHDCVPALAAWKSSLQAQAILRSKYAEVFRKSQFDCEGRVAAGEGAAPAAAKPESPPETARPAADPVEVRKATETAEHEIAAADRAAALVRELAARTILEAEYVLRSDLAGGQTRAEVFLAEARTSLANGTRTADLGALQNAAAVARSASQQLELLRRAAQNRIDALEDRARQTAAASPAASVEAVPSKVAPTSPISPSPPAAGKALPPASAAKPDSDLLSLMNTYIKGQYREAAAQSRRLTRLTGSDAAQARLFGSAANYQLFLRGGERDRALRDAALRDASEARRLDPGLQPDTRVFSPKFAEFYKNAGR
jgi:hypothetical protein